MVHSDDEATQRADHAYIRASMRRPLLSRDRELDLARRWREEGHAASLHELVGAYARLVVSTAARFRHYGLPLGDLVQEGNVGLMQAAARFEPEREVRFSTYADWWIRSAIQDFVLRNWSIVRTGTTAGHKTLFFNLRRLRAKLADTGAAGLSPEGQGWIAEQLGVTLREVETMEHRLAGVDQSLNLPVGEDGAEEWQAFLPDQSPSPEEVVIGMRDGRTRSRWLAEAIGQLSPREQTIIRRRRLAEESVTLDELGRQLGVSKERVRQLESRALLKLRAALERREAPPAG